MKKYWMLFIAGVCMLLAVFILLEHNQQAAEEVKETITIEETTVPVDTIFIERTIKIPTPKSAPRRRAKPPDSLFNIMQVRGDSINWKEKYLSLLKAQDSILNLLNRKVYIDTVSINQGLIRYEITTLGTLEGLKLGLANVKPEKIRTVTHILEKTKSWRGQVYLGLGTDLQSLSPTLALARPKSLIQYQYRWPEGSHQISYSFRIFKY